MRPSRTDNESAEVAQLRAQRPDIVRLYEALTPKYRDLCTEVSFILNRCIAAEEIEVSFITSREKSLRSVAEKLARKNYQGDLSRVTDLAGARVVYLYRADKPRIAAIIEREFEILERVDKAEVGEPSSFGYSAVHYLVRLSRQSSGVRYDELKALLCEIQVRTVLQDAWAVIDHHLIYKHEAAVPRSLLRRVSSLSGLLEVADDQFERVRRERHRYRREVQLRRKTPEEFLNQELNLDTFAEYLSWKFPRLPAAVEAVSLLTVFRDAQELGLATIEGLDRILERTVRARQAIAREKPPRSAIAEVIRALGLVYVEYRKLSVFNEEGLTRLEEYERLVSSVVAS